MDINTLKKHFSGDIVLPEDSAYPELSSTFMGKGSPAAIVIPHAAQDVAAAIQFAQSSSLLLSVRSGGHSAAGFGTNNGGLVIDLSKLDSVEIADEDSGLVRLGTGARWGSVVNFLKSYRLAISSGDTASVGVGGLALGGGIGWMVRKYGLAIDSVVSAEIVTADGKILQASETENPDLFWAIRGGGGNFGVVTSIVFRALAIDKVYSGTITYALDNVPSLLKSLRDYMRTADEALTTILNIMPSFGGNPPAARLTFCYAGTGEPAYKACEPLKSWGTVMSEEAAEKEYCEVLEEAHPPQGITIIVRNVLVKSLSDEAIQAIESVRTQTPGFILQVRMLGGAMARVPANATAFAHRDAEALLLSPAFLPPGISEDEKEKALTPWESIGAFGTGAYANFLTTATEKDIAAIYPEATRKRLAKIKKMYDPKNLFSQNHNIKPE